MLVLSREVGETVILTMPDGRRVVVTVVQLRDHAGRVRLGFDAPPDVAINRAEIQAHVDHRAASARPPRVPDIAPPPAVGDEDAPQSAGNGPPCDRRGGGPVRTARRRPKPGEPGYVPLRQREGR